MTETELNDCLSIVKAVAESYIAADIPAVIASQLDGARKINVSVSLDVCRLALHLETERKAGRL